MLKKGSPSGLKAFALLSLFMLVSVTIGAIFFSKVIMILMNNGWIRVLFGLIIFGALFAICGYALYNLFKKGVAISLFVWDTIRTALLKWFPSIHKFDIQAQQLTSFIEHTSVLFKRQYGLAVEKLPPQLRKRK